MKIFDYIKSSILCLRFPFLYPRNRWTGQHYNYWPLQKQITLLAPLKEDTTWVTERYMEKPAAYSLEYSLFFEINRNRYLIRPYPDHWVIMDDPMRNVYAKFSNDMIEGGNIVGVYWDTKNKQVVIRVDNPEAKMKPEVHRFIHLQKNEFMIKLSNILEFCHSVAELFHCLPDHTELDAMPTVWRKAFGIQICKDFRKVLYRQGGWKAVRSYRIAQIKEKYGVLDWLYPPIGGEAIYYKYVEQSKQMCCCCGKPTKYKSIGWIGYFCEDCIGNRARIEFNGRETENDESM